MGTMNWCSPHLISGAGFQKREIGRLGAKAPNPFFRGVLPLITQIFCVYPNIKFVSTLNRQSSKRGI
jgi:hypothetical protein